MVCEQSHGRDSDAYVVKICSAETRCGHSYIDLVSREGIGLGCGAFLGEAILNTLENGE